MYLVEARCDRSKRSTRLWREYRSAAGRFTRLTVSPLHPPLISAGLGVWSDRGVKSGDATTIASESTNHWGRLRGYRHKSSTNSRPSPLGDE